MDIFKNQKIHHLMLSQANILDWYTSSHVLEEELITNNDFLLRLVHSRFLVPLYNKTYEFVSETLGDAQPVVLYKSDYTPFIPVYTDFLTSKNIVKTKNIVTDDYYTDLFYRSMCANDLTSLLLYNQNIPEININPNIWSISTVHLKQARASSWKNAFEEARKKFSKQDTVDFEIDSSIDKIIEIAREQDYFEKMYVKKIELDKFKTKFQFIAFTKEDPYFKFNDFAYFLDEINRVNKENGYDYFLEVVAFFSKDESKLDMDKTMLVKNNLITN